MKTEDLGSQTVRKILSEPKLLSKTAEVTGFSVEEIEQKLSSASGQKHLKNALKEWPAGPAKNRADNPDATLNFKIFAPQGASSNITQAIKKLQAPTHAIWVTFSLEFLPEIASLFDTKKIKLSIICCHTKKISDGGIEISKSHFRKWTKYDAELKYLGIDQDAPLATKPKFGKLHGKALALHNGQDAIGIVGSFNLTYNSIYKNTETSILLEGDLATQLWEEAKFLKSKAITIT